MESFLILFKSVYCICHYWSFLHWILCSASIQTRLPLPSLTFIDSSFSAPPSKKSLTSGLTPLVGQLYPITLFHLPCIYCDSKWSFLAQFSPLASPVFSRINTIKTGNIHLTILQWPKLNLFRKSVITFTMRLDWANNFDTQTRK